MSIGPGVTNKDREHIGLPVPIFTYTLDQIATMIQMTEADLHKNVIWLTGREFGHRPLNRLAAVNIGPKEDEPTWRVEEVEFVRWCKHKRFRTFIRDWTIT